MGNAPHVEVLGLPVGADAWNGAVVFEVPVARLPDSSPSTVSKVRVTTTPASSVKVFVFLASSLLANALEISWKAFPIDAVSFLNLLRSVWIWRLGKWSQASWRRAIAARIKMRAVMRNRIRKAKGR